MLFGLGLLLLGCTSRVVGRQQFPAIQRGRWLLLASAEGHSVSIDTVSIVRTNASEFRASVLTEYPDDRRVAGWQYRATKRLADYRCDTREVRLYSMELLDSADRLVMRSAYPDVREARFSPVQPETMSEVELVRACDWVLNERRLVAPSIDTSRASLR